MSQSYMNPSVDANSYGSPMDQAIDQQNQQNRQDNDALYLSSGKTSDTTGGGRTLNIPKTLPPNKVPGPSYNGAVTIGDACQGGHCAIPVTPTVENLIHHNLNSANPPPGATVNYPGTDRLGNNQISMPDIYAYTGTENNPGPFNIQCNNFQCGSIQCGGDRESPFQYITHPDTRRVYNINSKKGNKILMKYLRQ